MKDLKYKVVEVAVPIPKKGFTIIEIIMVIIILGILAAVAIPQFFNLQARSELGVARQFEGALKIAAANYINTRVLRGLPGNPPTDLSYFVGADGTLGGTPGWDTIVIDPSIRPLLVVPNDTLLASNTITFNFRSGAVATYTLTAGNISATYTGF